MQGFMSRLDEVNADAEQAPGFIWRLQSEDGDATSVRPYPDERMLINLTVWESVDTLAAFVYRGVHKDVLQRGGEWFEPASEPAIALWWIPVGALPTALEGVERLARLRREGPSEHAFTFRKRFPPPSRATQD